MQSFLTRNVLVFPAGTEIGLEIFNSLKYCKEVNVFAAGDDSLNHGRFVYPQYHIIPNINEEGWLEALVSLCQKLAIDYIFPAYDDVIVALADNQQHIPSVVISSPKEACKITRSKSDTYHRLSGIVKVPRLYDSVQHVSDFPVLVKPDKGQGSFGITKVNNPAELIAAVQEVPEPLICEYLPGTEYTVDCFSDREQGVLFAKARLRRRTRNGISVNTVTESLSDIQDIAEKISTELKLRGAWFFQLKRDREDKLTLLEIAPRVAGSASAHRVMGINFPMLSIFEHERLPLKVLLNKGGIEVDRALANRYRHEIQYDTIYIDLDDTLIFREKVNTSVIKLIFQCINRGKQVKLITRHNQDIGMTLAKFRLAGLFDEVIHLRPGATKSAYITELNAILVDDSFRERLEVATVRGIPTFDCSMIEILVDEAQAIEFQEASPQLQGCGTQPLCQVL